MERDEIIKYLDNLVEGHDKMKPLTSAGDEELIICDPFTSGIHVYQGFLKMAEAVGRDILKEPHSIKNPYEFSFEYRGVRFFCIGEEPR